MQLLATVRQITSPSPLILVLPQEYGDTVFCASSNKYGEPVDTIAEMARMAAEISVLSIFE